MPPRQSGHGYSPAAQIEAAFRRIGQERMAGLPILNPALRVEVVGVSLWQGCRLAVLITPWCMNLILLPAKDEDSGAGHERLFYRFPSGDFAFLRGARPRSANIIPVPCSPRCPNSPIKRAPVPSPRPRWLRYSCRRRARSGPGTRAVLQPSQACRGVVFSPGVCPGASTAAVIGANYGVA